MSAAPRMFRTTTTSQNSDMYGPQIKRGGRGARRRSDRDSLPGLRGLVHRVGEAHIAHAGCEIGEADLLLAADRADELRLDPPVLGLARADLHRHVVAGSGRREREGL